MVDAEGEEAIAELLGGDEIGGCGVEGEEGRAEGGERGGGCDAAFGDLVEDAGTWWFD